MLLLHIFVLHILKIIICNFIITDFMLFKNKLSRYVYLHLNSIFSSITIDTINQQRLVQLPCILPSFFSIRVIWSWFHSVSRYMQVIQCYSYNGSRRGRDRIVVGFTTTPAISTYHHWRCEFEPRSWRCVLDTTLWKSLSVTCDKSVGFSGYSGFLHQ